MRKCRLGGCRKEIPSLKLSDFPQSKGFCDFDHMTKHGLTKARAILAKQDRAKHREAKEKIKKRTAWVADAQRLLNQIVVIEDKPKGCITCGSPDVTDAGHYFHRGNKYRVSPLTLLRLNLNGQCELCNRWEGGRQHDYMEGFIERYGQARFDELVEYRRRVDSGDIAPLTIDDCKALIAEYRVKIKQMKQTI